MGKLKDDLKKLVKFRADLGTAVKGTPIDSADVSSLQKKLDSIIANTNKFLPVEEAMSKDVAAVVALEKKMKTNIDTLNGLLDKMEDGASEGQKVAGPIMGALNKLPAFKKAADVVSTGYADIVDFKGDCGLRFKDDGIRRS